MKLEPLFSLAGFSSEVAEGRLRNAVNSRGCNQRHGEDS